jgi:2,4-dienoyl-CoA reductase-like NADH-dependent reductase (Old Yellow Enzyme family)
MSHTRVATLRSSEQFREHLSALQIQMPFDDSVMHGPDAPLAQPLDCGIKTVGNRFTILPMEGWDGEANGTPSDLTLRRWTRFGSSGAKLIWGGEAVAVRHDGRASPNQLVAAEHTLGGLVKLREALTGAHQAGFGRTDDLLIGLQLTHSGRFSKPNDKKRLEPRTAYKHPWLDQKFHVPDDAVFSDDDIARLIEDFGRAAGIAQRAGFEFVDLKHCHGYLGHELLSAHERPGRYGGSFENRTRFLRELVDAVQAAAPGLGMGVRLSAFDFMPFKPGPEKSGVPDVRGDGYRYAFGGDGTGLGIDLSEPKRFLDLLASLNIRLVSITAGSPYYVPHIQRPALFPPSDGYLPPEDPLCGVARQINVTAELKRHNPNLIIVGTGYSYLQEWLSHVAQAAVRTGAVDSVGLGRMVLSYPELPADVLSGRELQRKLICRTFSDCTTAPRNGLTSGCYPLDDFYKNHPQRVLLDAAKQKAASAA